MSKKNLQNSTAFVLIGLFLFSFSSKAMDPMEEERQKFEGSKNSLGGVRRVCHDSESKELGKQPHVVRALDKIGHESQRKKAFIARGYQEPVNQQNLLWRYVGNSSR